MPKIIKVPQFKTLMAEARWMGRVTGKALMKEEDPWMREFLAVTSFIEPWHKKRKSAHFHALVALETLRWLDPDLAEEYRRNIAKALHK